MAKILDRSVVGFEREHSGDWFQYGKGGALQGIPYARKPNYRSKVTGMTFRL